MKQLQLVASLGRIKRGVEKAASKPRYRFQLEVAKPLLFDGNLVGSSFVVVCKLYIRMRMREESVEE